jgi:acetylornithine deacetylase/succinyl-diaminopimelate desuccinylase-like protein
MDSRLSVVVSDALTVDGAPPVRLPTLGGYVPFSEFSEGLGIPTVGIALVNHDNNQHGPNENIRLGTLWQSIELLSRILVMPR